MSGKKISVANVESMKEINIKNCQKFEISFEKIDALWENDLKMAENKLYGSNVETIDALKKSLKEIVIDDDDDKATMKNKVEKKNEIKRAIEKAEKLESKKNDNEQKKIADYAAHHGELVKYIRDRVFSTNVEGYYLIEQGRLAHKNKGQIDKLFRKLRAKHGKIAINAIDDNSGLFRSEVTSKDCMIDVKNKLINLAKRFNYMYDPKVDEEKGEFILSFIREVITGNKDDRYKCLLDIMTCGAHRKQSQVILFLCALGGTGKTTFTNILAELFGEAYANSNEDVMSGETQFNHMLVGSAFATLEETSGKGSENYKKLMRSLKEMATSKKLTARKMFQESFDVDNILNLIVLSNHVDIEVGDRRVFTPEISNERIGDSEYFAKLNAYIRDKKAMQYVFNYIYNRDVPEFVIPPMTETKQNYKDTNIHTSVKYVIEEYMVKNQYENHSVKTSELFKKYRDWAKENKITHACTEAVFRDVVSKHVKKVLNAEGKEIVCQNVKKYDLSYQSLYDNMIKHLKVISEERLKELQEDFKENGDAVDDSDDDKDRNEFEQQIDFLKTQLTEKDKKLSEMEELVKKLQEQINEIKTERTEKKKPVKSKSDKRLVEMQTATYKKSSEKIIDIDNDNFTEMIY